MPDQMKICHFITLIYTKQTSKPCIVSFCLQNTQQKLKLYFIFFLRFNGYLHFNFKHVVIVAELLPNISYFYQDFFKLHHISPVPQKSDHMKKVAKIWVGALVIGQLMKFSSLAFRQILFFGILLWILLQQVRLNIRHPPLKHSVAY